MWKFVKKTKLLFLCYLCYIICKIIWNLVDDWAIGHIWLIDFDIFVFCNSTLFLASELLNYFCLLFLSLSSLSSLEWIIWRYGLVHCQKRIVCLTDMKRFQLWRILGILGSRILGKMVIYNQGTIFFLNYADTNDDFASVPP